MLLKTGYRSSIAMTVSVTSSCFGGLICVNTVVLYIVLLPKKNEIKRFGWNISLRFDCVIYTHAIICVHLN